MKILWSCMFHSTWQNILLCISKTLCEFSLQCLLKSYHKFRLLNHILFYLDVTLNDNDEWHYLSTDLVFIMYWSIKRESLTGQSYFIKTRIDNMKTDDWSFSIRMCIKSLIGILYKFYYIKARSILHLLVKILSTLKLCSVFLITQ